MSLSDFWFGAGRGAAGNALQQGQQYQYIGQNPYQGQQNALIQQLQQQAAGNGPSIAAMQAQQSGQEAMANQLALSRGRGAGAARNAGNQLGQIGQNIAGQSALARLREQMAAQQALQGSLTAAGQMDYQRAAANQGMYQNALQSMMQQGGIGQSLAGLAGQGLGAYAMLRNPGMPGNSGQGQQQGYQPRQNPAPPGDWGPPGSY